VRAIVLTGAGEKAFVAGADINELAVLRPAQGKEHARQGQHVFDLIEHLGTRIDLGSVRAEPPGPDRFVYAFWLRGEEVVVPEQALTPELSRLASLVLDD